MERILEHPTVKEYWVIALDDPLYVKRVGGRPGGMDLMLSLGFLLTPGRQALSLAPPGQVWETVPPRVCQAMLSNLRTLALYELGIPIADLPQFATIAEAVCAKGLDEQHCERWKAAVATAVKLVDNVLDNPSDSRFRRISTANGKLQQTILDVPDGRRLLYMLGFREHSGGLLILPDEVSVRWLQARRLELQVCTISITCGHAACLLCS
jgi:hypothetical protein